MPISYIRPTSYFSSMFRNDLIILYPDSKTQDNIVTVIQ